MKILFGVLLFVYSVSAVELGSFIPLHFSCIDPSVHTDFGLVSARLDVFKKGTTFNSQLILSKDNSFVTGYKQASFVAKSNGEVNFIPQGPGHQITKEGIEIPLERAALSISQSTNMNIQVRFNFGSVGPSITYESLSCR